MSTSRFSFTNWLVKSTTSIRAVTAEDPNFPASNLLIDDRYVTYSRGAAASGLAQITFDLGTGYGNFPVDFIGVSGLQVPNGFVWPNLMSIYYGNTYPPTTDIGHNVPVGRPLADHAVVNPRMYARYWSFGIQPVAPGIGFTLGNIILGRIDQDLGISHSPNATRQHVATRVRSRAIGGQPTVTEVGSQRELLVLPFIAIPQSIMDSIDKVAAATTFYYLDQDDVLRQCALSGDQITRTHRWDSPDLWDASLELEVLP